MNNINDALKEQVTNARDEAMQNYLAGSNVTPEANLNATKETLGTNNQTATDINKLTNDTDMYSKYGLLNQETGQAKDSNAFTNYINSGNKVKAEDQAQVDSIVQKEKTNSLLSNTNLSTQDAVSQAYSKQTASNLVGGDITSSSYWGSNYQNNNFESPLDNSTIQDEISQVDMSKAQSQIVSNELNTTLSDSALSMLTDNVDVDQAGVNFKTVSEVFTGLQQLTGLGDDDEKFYQKLNSGQISASLRLYQDSDGVYHYLHTDGKVYTLDNDRTTEGHGIINVDDDGTVNSITLNNGVFTTDFSLVSEAVAGGTSVVTGLVDLVTTIVDGAAEVLQDITGTDDKDTFGFGLTEKNDAMINNYLGAFTQSNRISFGFGGSDTFEDILFVGANMAGSFAASYLTYGVFAPKLIQAGTALQTSGATKIGKGVEWLGRGMIYQSGNFGAMVDKNLTAATYTAASTWGRRAKMATFTNARSLLKTIETGIAQASMYDEDDRATDLQIGINAAATFFINGAIDFALNGGQDDNQLQVYSAWMQQFDPDSKIAQLGKKLSLENTDLSNLVFKKNMTIGINSLMDFTANIFTGGWSATDNLDNGKVPELQDRFNSWMSDVFSMDNLLRGGINTAWYSTKGQIENYNAGIDSLRETHNDIVTLMNTKMIDAHNSGNDVQYNAVKEVLDEYKTNIENYSREEECSCREEAIYRALNDLNEKMKDGEGDVWTPLKESLIKNARFNKIEAVRNVYEQSKFIYDQGQAYRNKIHEEGGIKEVLVKVRDILPGLRAFKEKETANRIDPLGNDEIVGGYKKEINYVQDTRTHYSQDPDTKLYKEDPQGEYVKTRKGAYTKDTKTRYSFDPTANEYKQDDKGTYTLEATGLVKATNEEIQAAKWRKQVDAQLEVVKARINLEDKSNVLHQANGKTGLSIVSGVDNIEKDQKDSKIRTAIAQQLGSLELGRISTFYYIANQEGNPDKNANGNTDTLSALDWLERKEFIKSIDVGDSVRGGKVYYISTDDSNKLQTIFRYQNVNTIIEATVYLLNENIPAEDRYRGLMDLFTVATGEDKPTYEQKQFVNDMLDKTYDRLDKKAMIVLAEKFKINGNKGGRTAILLDTFKKFSRNSSKNNQLDLGNADTVKALRDLAASDAIKQTDLDNLINKYNGSISTFLAGSANRINVDDIKQKLTSHDFEALNPASYKYFIDNAEVCQAFAELIADVFNNTDMVTVPTILDGTVIQGEGKDVKALRRTANNLGTDNIPSKELKAHAGYKQEIKSALNFMFSNGIFVTEPTQQQLDYLKEKFDYTPQTSKRVLKDTHAKEKIEIDEYSYKIGDNQRVSLLDDIKYVDGDGKSHSGQSILRGVLSNTMLGKLSVKFKLSAIPRMLQYSFFKYKTDNPSIQTVLTAIRSSDLFKMKTGKTAGGSEGIFRQSTYLGQCMYSEDYDETLNKYFISAYYLGNIIKSKSVMPLSEDEADYINTHNTMWRVETDNDNSYAHLKYSNINDALKDLPNHSLKEVFPFEFFDPKTKPDDNKTSMQFVYGSLRTKGTDSPNRMMETSLKDFNNIPWSQDGIMEAKFFNYLMSEDANNPIFDQYKNADPVKAEYIDGELNYSKYKKDISKSNNPCDILLNRYIDTFEKETYDPNISDAENTDYVILLRGNTLERLIKNPDISIDKLKQKYKEDIDYYKQHGVEALTTDTYPNNYSGEVLPTGEVAQRYSADLIREMIGSNFVLEDTDIDKVFSEVNLSKAKEAIANAKTRIEQGKVADTDGVYIELSDEAKLVSMITRASGNIALEDIRDIVKLINKNDRCKELIIELFGDGIVDKLNKQKENLDKYYGTKQQAVKNYTVSNTANYVGKNVELVGSVEVKPDVSQEINELETLMNHEDDIIWRAEARIRNNGISDNEETILIRNQTNHKFYDMILSRRDNFNNTLPLTEIQRLYYDSMPLDSIKEIAGANEITPHEFINKLIDYENDKLNNQYYRLDELRNKTNTTFDLDNFKDSFEEFAKTKKDNIDLDVDAKLLNQFEEDIETKINNNRAVYSAYSISGLDDLKSANNAVGYTITSISTFNELKNRFGFDNTADDAINEKFVHIADVLSAIHRGEKNNKQTFYVIDKDNNLVDDLISDSPEALLIKMTNNKDAFNNVKIIVTNGRDNLTLDEAQSIKFDILDLSNNTVKQQLYDKCLRQMTYTGYKLHLLDENEINAMLGGELTLKEMQDIANRIPSDSVSSLEKERQTYNNYSEQTLSPISYPAFRKIMYSANSYLANMDMIRIAQEAALKGEDINDDRITDLVRSLAFGGLDRDMSEDRKEMRQAIQDGIGEKINNDNNLTPEQKETYLKFFNDILSNDSSIEAIDYLVHQRTLEEMKQDYYNNDIHYEGKIGDVTDEDVVAMASKDFSKIKVIYFDTETGILQKVAQQRPFQIGLVDSDGDKEDLFIMYTGCETKAGREKWVEDNIFKTKKGRDFYRDEPGYKEAVDKFINGGNDVKYITVDNLKTKLLELTTDANDRKVILCGHNIEKFDNIVMNNILGNDFIETNFPNRLDTIETAIFNNKTIRDESSVKLSILAGEDAVGSHSAGFDAETTRNKLSVMIDGYHSIGKMRSALTLKAEQYGLDDEAIKYFDNIKSESQNEYETSSGNKLNDWFGGDITNKTIGLSTQIVQHVINSRFANYVASVKDLMEFNMLDLSNEAKTALTDNKQFELDRLYSIYMEANPDVNDKNNSFLSNLSLFLYDRYGTVNTNTILEFCGDDDMKNIFLRSQLNLTDDIINNHKENKFNIKDAPVDAQSKVLYESYGSAFHVYNSITGVLKQLKNIGVDNETALNEIMYEMSLIYSTAKGENVNIRKALGEDIEVGKTRYMDIEKGVLQDVKNTDGIMRMKKKGSYSFLGTLRPGTVVRNEATGKDVKLDATCIIMSPELANKLNVQPNDTGADIYTYLLAQPGDNPNKLIPLKVVVNSDVTGDQVQVSEVVSKLLARDHDGDHVTVTAVPSGEQDIMKMWVDNMSTMQIAQSEILQYLRSNKDSSVQELDSKIFEAKTDKEVANICRRIDSLLDDYDNNKSKIDSLTEELRTKINSIVPDKNKAKKLIEDLGVHDIMNGSDHVRYVGNQQAWRNDDGSIARSAKEYNDYVLSTYAYNYEMYRPLDAISGMNEKDMFKVMNNMKFDGYKDFTTSGNYLVDLITDELDGISSEQLDDVFEIIDRNYGTNSKEIRDKAQAALSKGQIDDVATLLDIAMRTSEETRLNNFTEDDNTNFRNALIDAVKNQNGTTLATVRNMVDRYNQLTAHDNMFTSSANVSYDLDEAEQKTLKQYIDDNEAASMMMDLVRNEETHQVFVVTGQEGNDIGSSDQIYYNKNATKKAYIQEFRWYKKSDFTPGRNAKDGVISNDQKYLGKVKSSNEEVDGNVIKQVGDYYAVGKCNEINGDIKLASSSYGGKGALGTVELDPQYSDIQFLIKENTKNKIAFPTSIKNTSDKTTITVKINGKDVKLTGYYTDSPILPIESNQTWRSVDEERNVDLMQRISNASSFSALFLEMLKIDDEGNLISNIEDWQEAAASLNSKRLPIQLTNMIPVLNKIKFAIAISFMSEDDIKNEFKTSKDEFLRNKMDSLRCANPLYGNEALNLLERTEKGREFLNTDLGKQLFGNGWIKKVKNYRELVYSNGNTLIDKDGKATSSVGKKRIASETINEGSESADSLIKVPSADLKNPNYISFEQGNMDIIQLLDLFGIRLSKDKIESAYRSGGITTHAEHVADSASAQNGWHHTDTRYTKDSPRFQQDVSTESKTFLPLPQGKVTPLENAASKEVSLEPESFYRHSGKSEDGVIQYVDALTRDDSNMYSVRLSNMINKLMSLNAKDSLQNKIDSLSVNKTYGTMDSHIDVYIDDDGNIKTGYRQGQWRVQKEEQSNREFLKELRSSMYNYLTMKSIVNDDKQYAKIDQATDSEVGFSLTTNMEKAKAFNDLYDSMRTELNKNIEDKRSEMTASKSYASYTNVTVLKNGAKSIIGNNKISQLASRSGIDISTVAGANADAAIKKANASAAEYKQELYNTFTSTNHIINGEIRDKDSKQKFISSYSLYKTIEAKGIDDYSNNLLKQLGYKNEDELIKEVNYYKDVYAQSIKALDSYQNTIMTAIDYVSNETGEVLGTNLFGLLCPYIKSNTVEDKKANVSRVIQTMSNLTSMAKRFGNVGTVKFNNGNTEEFVYDFENSSKIIINELSRIISAKAVAEALVNPQDITTDKNGNKVRTGTELTNAELLDLVDKTFDEVVAEVNVPNQKTGHTTEDEGYRDYVRDVYNTIRRLTGVSLTSTSNYSANDTQRYYRSVNTRLQEELGKYKTAHPSSNLVGYSAFYEASLKDNSDDPETEVRIANLYYSKMVLAQVMISGANEFTDKFYDKINQLNSEGKVIVNKWGQKLEQSSFMKTISPISTMGLLDNIEIAIHGSISGEDLTSEQKDINAKQRWAMFLASKIVSGDAYFCNKETADALEKNYYTYEMPKPLQAKLRKMAKYFAGIQMANPLKVGRRFLQIGGFDYSNAFAYCGTDAFKYIPDCWKEIKAAFHSNGAILKDERYSDLRTYLTMEGQPIGSGHVYANGLEFDGDGTKFDQVVAKLNKPLQFENHTGRYVIFKAALDSFRQQEIDGTEPNYGPCYFMKDRIDALPTAEDKAMAVMDMMLGSPGGFPKAAQKINGYMMYTTFPLNYLRTTGAYAQSAYALIRDSVRGETNSKTWINHALTPLGGFVGAGLFAYTLSWLLCKLYGLTDDETEDIIGKWYTQEGTLDPIGTLLGGEPSAMSSPTSPIGVGYTSFIKPIENAATKFNQGKTVEGALSLASPVVSHLNPLIKDPIEAFTGYETYSNSATSTKNKYTTGENIARKIISALSCSEMANALVKQYKMDTSSDKGLTFQTLVDGLTKGVSASLGNQKSYKSDTTNYYNMLTLVKTAVNNQSSSNYTSDVTTDDLINGDYNEYADSSDFDYDDYQRMVNMMRMYITDKAEPKDITAYVTKEFNDNGVSATTIRSALNAVSINRQLSKLEDKEAFYATLTSEEQAQLEKALKYEETYLPDLSKLVTQYAKSSTSSYSSGYSSNYSSNYGSTSNYSSNYYSASTPYFHSIYASNPYFKSIYYNNYYNKKYKNNNNKKRVVQVDKNMGLGRYGVQDFKPNLYYKNNPIYNNLSDYQKQKKVGER